MMSDDRLREVLTRLSGNGLDWSRWTEDSLACESIVSTLSQLWMLPQASNVPPASVFGAAWQVFRGQKGAAAADEMSNRNQKSAGQPPISGVPDCLASVESCAISVRTGTVSVREVAEWVLANIESADGKFRAFTHVSEEDVLAQADALDQRRRMGLGPLAGVPIGVKDLLDVKGLRTSYGSPAFFPYVAHDDSRAVAQLKAADALVVGKTRTSEFAWSTITPPTKNPRNLDLVAGGSSGGSAAAVAGGLVLGALGTDTGGSIRIPAALCGVVGMKPTYGLVSRAGVLPANFSLDHVGPFAQSLSDIRLLLSALIGHDSADPGSADKHLIRNVAGGLATPKNRRVERLRLGVLEGPLFEIVDREVQDEHQNVLDRLAQAGVNLVGLRVPEADFVPAAAMAIDLAEGAALHTERLRDHGADFGPNTRRLLHFAHTIPGVILARGHQARRYLSQTIADVYASNRLDAIVAPASPSLAIAAKDINASRTLLDGRHELVLAGYSRVCWLANLTGQPAIVIPYRLTPTPLAIQLIGRPFMDHELIDLGEAIEDVVAESVPGRDLRPSRESR